jgi:hypothetical protein
MKTKFITTTLLTLSLGLATNAFAMEKNTIYNMPADSDFSKYYLANDLQPKKGGVSTADGCMKACQAVDACVVWTFKPGRFGSPGSCKLSPKMMKENGEKAQFAGAASGVVESR